MNNLNEILKFNIKLDNIKLKVNKNKDYYDIDISTKYYNIYDNYLWYKYSNLFGEKCIKDNSFICNEPFIYSTYFIDYYYINKISFIIDKKIKLAYLNNNSLDIKKENKYNLNKNVFF